jgi:2-polyprenyl-3-methyl-5-hydroxy-6-metoxy-1,4-benzoquinol methylase
MDCPICECENVDLFQRKEDRALLICADCRHVFFNEHPTVEQSAAYYTSVYTGSHDQLDIQASHAEYYRSHAKELADLTTGGSIVDIGCSIPVFLREAEGVFAERIGVDLSQEAHSLGTGWGLRMITPDEFDSLVPVGSLDVLRYSHVLEHLSDPMGVLLANIKKLKHGGLLYITQPNFPVFKFGMSGAALMDNVWPEHLHYFNPLSLARMIERTGLTMFRFLCHGEADTAYGEYASSLDLSYARNQLAALEPLTVVYEPMTEWPIYAGINSGCYARMM